MIRAQPHGLRAALWRWYVARKLRHAFRGIWVRGAVPEGAAARGLLVYANHTSFWDGFALHALARAHGWQVRCAMEERNLARWPFLARLGAFSIRRGDARSALETFRYAKRQLRGGATVCLFPEGVLTPQARPPLRLERGIEVLAALSGARCMPVALRYAFFEDEKPDLLIDVGPPHAAAKLAHFQAELDARVAGLLEARLADGFRPIVRGIAGMVGHSLPLEQSHG